MDQPTTDGVNTYFVSRAAAQAGMKVALSGLGGAVAISTIADVTFYGRDQVGNEVSVMGSISVNFADWADEEED